ncbi:hypothetical protein ABIC78_002847 [Novosphingobium sp. 1529]|uniref:hypothetical protein n=1 Tax=Novosphingobium sp. 1529 TaxID=3156424 RepID=UPI00339B30B8
MNSILPLDHDEIPSFHKREASAADLRSKFAGTRKPIQYIWGLAAKIQGKSLGGVDKFRSGNAGSKNRRFKEARKRNIANIARRADAVMAVFASSPAGVAL